MTTLTIPTVLIPLAKGFEELEAVTLIDLLRRANIKVITTSLTEQQLVESCHGVSIMADTALDTVFYDDFDMIVLPGGQPGTDNLNENPQIKALLKRLDREGKAIAAICAAPMVLADTGLLKGKKATSYPSTLTVQQWPDIILSEEAVVIDRAVLTSRGPGTAMDFALAIIGYLMDEETQKRVENSLVRP